MQCDSWLLIRADPDLYGSVKGPPMTKTTEQTAGVTAGEWTADDIAELKRMVPDLNAVLTHNPINQVYFRAGLLACREVMARFVEQGGSDIEKKIAISIRANWWPSLGDDPGPPRKLNWDEIADEKPDGKIDCKDMSPSVEALPIAHSFIVSPLSKADAGRAEG